MKILYSIPPIHHVDICKLEMDGLRKLGYDCLDFEFGNNDNSNYLKKFIKTIYKALSLTNKCIVFKPDLIYLNSRISNVGFFRDFVTLAILFVFYKKKAIIVYKSHGSDSSIFLKKNFLQETINHFLLKHVSYWFVLSEDEKYDLESSAKISNVSVIKNIIITLSNSEKILPGTVSSGKFKILFAGRLIKEKGVFDIINAIDFYKFNSESIFLFAGEGPEYENLIILIKEKKIDNVLFLGQLSQNDLNKLYGEVDILLFPSYDEGLSIVLFSCICVGLPVITTKIRAAKDYLIDNKNVLWVEINDPVMIGDKLNCLFLDLNLRIIMSENNKSIANMFSQNSVCNEISEIIGKIS